jgi:hypothetical protein
MHSSSAHNFFPLQSPLHSHHRPNTFPKKCFCYNTLHICPTYRRVEIRLFWLTDNQSYWAGLFTYSSRSPPRVAKSSREDRRLLTHSIPQIFIQMFLPLSRVSSSLLCTEPEIPDQSITIYNKILEPGKS